MEHINNYKVLRLLKSARRSQIFEVIDKHTHRRATLKLLYKKHLEDAVAYARFLREMHIVTLIKHPNIVEVFEVAELADGACFFVMEYIEGETLRDRLLRIDAPLERRQAVHIAQAIATAIAAAHKHQLFHHGLSPSDIMLVAEPGAAEIDRIKVLNFGVARLLEHSIRALDADSAAAVASPVYMSPERCEGREVGDRSDVYELGILLYEMLAGRPPFLDTQGPLQVMMAQLQHDPPPLRNHAPDAGTELCALVHRMLAKRPTERPNADEISTQLASLQGAHSRTAAPPSGAVTAASSAQALQAASPPSVDDLQKVQGRRRVLLAISAAVAVGIGMWGLRDAVRSRRTAQATPITWSIDSQPSDAELVDDTEGTLGRTPFRVVLPRRPGLVSVTLKKDGYLIRRIVLDRSQDEMHRVTLLPLPPSPIEVLPPGSPEVGRTMGAPVRTPQER